LLAAKEAAGSRPAWWLEFGRITQWEGAGIKNVGGIQSDFVCHQGWTASRISFFSWWNKENRALILPILARQQAIDSNILYVDFTESMTGDTCVEQIARTKDLPESELNYYGLCMFGGKQQIDAITSRFSLWR
jgi:hypothetical protein